MSRVKEYIPLSLIDMDRIPMDEKSLEFAIALRGYASAGLVKAEFPAIKVAKKRNGRYAIRDGRHRWLAHKLAGEKKILAKFSTEPLRGLL